MASFSPTVAGGGGFDLKVDILWMEVDVEAAVFVTRERRTKD